LATRVEHDRDVLVALLEGRFVHRQVSRQGLLAPLEPTGDGSTPNRIDGTPTQTQATTYRFDRCFQQPIDDQRFHHRRELGARLAPRDADLFDTVLLAPYPRHLGYENRLQLAGVQVTPTAHHAVVAGARCPALGARQRAGEVGKVDFHFAGA